jgi:hypothetical protein
MDTNWQKPDEIIDPNLDLGSQAGRKLMTTLAQEFMGPYIITGKAYLWAALPWCFLPK